MCEGAAASCVSSEDCGISEGLPLARRLEQCCLLLPVQSNYMIFLAALVPQDGAKVFCLRADVKNCLLRHGRGGAVGVEYKWVGCILFCLTPLCTPGISVLIISLFRFLF